MNMYRHTAKNRRFTVIHAVLLALILCLGLIVLTNRRHIKDIQAEARRQQQLLIIHDERNNGLLEPVVSIKDEAVYIPEMRLKLPMNETTRRLRYSVDAQNGLRITSTLVADPALERTISCDEPVRLMIEDNVNEYNPEDKHYLTMPRTDGKKLQIYFNENKSCMDEAWTAITPRQIGEQFRKAEQY